MDLLSLYVGALFGLTVGMILAGIWIDRKPKKPEWWDEFVSGCALTRRQAMGRDVTGNMRAEGITEWVDRTPQDKAEPKYQGAGARL